MLEAIYINIVMASAPVLLQKGYFLKELSKVQNVLTIRLFEKMSSI